MDQVTELPAFEADGKAALRPQEADKPAAQAREWTSQHPINLRVSLPLPFGRWYVTLVAGRERRGKDRLKQERKKHPLETMPNLMFLLSVGIVTSTLLLMTTALILIHDFGWSIQLNIPA